MNETKRWKVGFWIVVVGACLLLSIQKMYHRYGVQRMRLHKAIVSAVDDKTGNKIAPSITARSGPSFGAPFNSRTTWSSHPNGMACEWIGIGPREIQISREGYSTQSVVVMAGTTNIAVSLTRLKRDEGSSNKLLHGTAESRADASPSVP